MTVNSDIEILGQHKEELEDTLVAAGFAVLRERIKKNNVKNGFWVGATVDVHQKLNLIFTELAEVVEGLRDGNPPDKHLPQFKSTEVEMADTVIRIIDLCNQAGWDLTGAILAKDKFNSTRDYLHGRRF